MVRLCAGVGEQRGCDLGNTREEAFRNIHEVARMVIEDMMEGGERIPEGVLISDEPLVSVTV